MKKLLFIPVLLGAFYTAKAQDEASKVGFGVKAGYNLANITSSSDGAIEEKNGISSFNVGVYADLPIMPILSVQAGLTLNGKGTKYTIGDKSTSNWAERTISPKYLEIPVNLVVKIPFSSTSNIFVGAGPYVAMGLFGKTKYEASLLGIQTSNSENIEFGNDDPINNNNGKIGSGNLKRFDFGFNLLGGVQIKRFSVGLGVGLGMVNVNPGFANDKNDQFKNVVGSLNFGYLF